MSRVATIAELIHAECAMRSLIDENDLPQPDRVEYGHSTVWLRWDDRKLVVAIEVGAPPQ
jgi:hypothetical protein